MSKKFFYFILLTVVSGLTSSCSNNKQKVEKENEYVDVREDQQMERSSADTLSMVNLATEFLNAIKNNQLEEAIGMLNEIDSTGVSPLTEQRKNEIRNQYKTFPIVNFTIDQVLLYSEDDSEIRYTAEIFEKTEENKDLPNTVKGVLCPLRRDGKWYLTLPQVKVENNFEGNN